MKEDWVVFRRISILAVIREMRTFQTLVLIFVCIIHSYSQEAEVVKCANCNTCILLITNLILSLLIL